VKYTDKNVRTFGDWALVACTLNGVVSTKLAAFTPPQAKAVVVCVLEGSTLKTGAGHVTRIVADDPDGAIAKYTCDTKPGFSGSPIWQTQNNKTFIVGIHNRGKESEQDENGFLVFNDEIRSFLSPGIGGQDQLNR
jgi:V8-like Glu-specific endopeptidase